MIKNSHFDRQWSYNIELPLLVKRLNEACSNGTKPELETLQEARDIIEYLMIETKEEFNSRIRTAKELGV
jgi:hypothetical protein